MSQRKFFILALISLALFALTAVARRFAAGYPRSWTTLQWTDHGTSVSETIDGFGWYENGLQWIHIDAAAGPELDLGSVQEVRNYLVGVVPAGQRKASRETGFESYLVQSETHDFRFGKGSYVRRGFELTFDGLAAGTAVLSALWIFFQLVRGSVHFFPLLVRERRWYYCNSSDKRFGKVLDVAARLSFILFLMVLMLWFLCRYQADDPWLSASLGNQQTARYSIDPNSAEVTFRIVEWVQAPPVGTNFSAGTTQIVVGSIMPGISYGVATDVMYRDDGTNIPLATKRDRRYFVQYLVFLVAFAMVPLFWLVDLLRLAVRQHRRAGKGLCKACGYSLAGNTSGICPECGNAVVVPVRS